MTKKISKLLPILFLSIFATEYAHAQLQVGGGFIYGSEVEELGIQVNGVLDLPSSFRAAADIGIFFTDDAPGTDTGFWELDINGHYLFPGVPKANVYALAGLNFATASLEIDALNVDESNTELGINIGGGAEIPLPFAKLYGELKYVLGDADQLVFGAGLRFGLGN